MTGGDNQGRDPPAMNILDPGIPGVTPPHEALMEDQIVKNKPKQNHDAHDDDKYLFTFHNSPSFSHLTNHFFEIN